MWKAMLMFLATTHKMKNKICIFIDSKVRRNEAARTAESTGHTQCFQEARFKADLYIVLSNLILRTSKVS